jgi:cystathionine gamma-lyase
MRFDTRLIHASQPPETRTGAVNTPIYLSSTFAQPSPGTDQEFVYGRTANPTRTVLERALADLEGGRVGLAFSSGMGAITTLLESLPSRRRIVAVDDLYGGTFRIFEHHRRQFDLEIEYVDMTDPSAVESAVASAPTAWVYAESPTNPLLRLVDLRRVARIAHAHRSLFVVDNTFASPANQRPIEHGADVVVHSTTKYIGGHSDILGGALIARDRRLGQRLAWLQNAVGAVPSPFDCFLALRGLRTLGVRMRAHEASARTVTEFLESDRRVKTVRYPGSKSHPQHALARRQMDGFAGMVSFELTGGFSAARRLLRALRIFTLAESLGGVESLVDHPATMTHASVPRAEREAHGVTDGLVRLSCGIEDPADLVDDLQRALSRV